VWPLVAARLFSRSNGILSHDNPDRRSMGAMEKPGQG
jgi:hypothetical protein